MKYRRRLERLETRYTGAEFTDKEWRLFELVTLGEPIPPELRHVKIPIELLRSVLDDDDTEGET